MEGFGDGFVAALGAGCFAAVRAGALRRLCNVPYLPVLQRLLLGLLIHTTNGANGYISHVLD